MYRYRTFNRTQRKRSKPNPVNYRKAACLLKAAAFFIRVAMDVIQLKKHLQSIDIRKIAVDAIKATSADIVEQQKAQLYSGKRIDGAFIRPPYAPTTIVQKIRKGQPFDRVTLKDTGDFYEGIFITVGTEYFNLTSSDEKTTALAEKYTPKIFGLNEHSLSEYKKDVEPVFINMIKQATGL